MTAKIPWTARAFLSVEETAVLLGLSPSTLYRSLHRGDFPISVVQVNGRIRVPRRALEHLIEGRIRHSFSPSQINVAPHL
jgi:excisionase family DNA binding protein